MSSKNTAIKEAIDQFDRTRARKLIREALLEADAETYYLGSFVAVDDKQKRAFLNKALELDPFHEQAHRELDRLNYVDMDSKWTEKTKNRSISHSYAGFWARFFAFIIDGIILSTSGFIVGFVYGMVVPPPSISNYFYEVDYVDAFIRWQMIAGFLGFLLGVAYTVYFLTMQDGQTPGKAAMNIRIAKENGKDLTIVDALLRNYVGYTISGFFLILGYIWMLFDDKNQTWHDKLVKTVVIKT